MCGICGVVHRDPTRPVDPAMLVRMRDTMVHRGPDDAGIYTAAGVGLGHRRLSIIDLATGAQPMANTDRTVWIVFNGEIYNYVELRDAVRGGRHTFTTSSDTEVLVRLYETFGDELVTHLNGMFAFALWDERQRRLLLARDRVGEKPLYYTACDGDLVFASEIKALLQHPSVRAELEPTAVDEFMAYGYVQTPRTIFRDICRVPEGHILEWRNGRISIRQYWDFTFEPDERATFDDHVARVRELLTDAVRLRLRSDVPLGVLLSGGVDSSAVTALLARAGGRVKTFSIGFDGGPAFNEQAYARRVAREFHTDHHEIILSPQAFRDFVPSFVHHMDEPVTEAAAIPLYFVSKLSAQHVKVVLSGEGSDELFGGYPIYRYMQWIERFRRLPAGVRSAATRALLAATDSPKVRKYAQLARLPLDRRYLNVHLYDPALRASIYTPEFQSRLAAFDPADRLRPYYRRTETWDVLSRLLYVDTKTWLPNNLLIKADRMSMAASIELRVPFLDHRLVEYAATIPSRFKIKGAEGKHILKRALSGLLPREILYRPKMGFPTPVARMFKGDLSTFVDDMLLDRRAITRGIVDPQAVRRLVDEHRSGRADHQSALWRLIILEQWQRRYLDAAAPTPAGVRP
jgi:asparagine synthase (glutamine-hydrolysing)